MARYRINKPVAILIDNKITYFRDETKLPVVVELEDTIGQRLVDEGLGDLIVEAAEDEPTAVPDPDAQGADAGAIITEPDVTTTGEEPGAANVHAPADPEPEKPAGRRRGGPVNAD